LTSDDALSLIYFASVTIWALVVGCNIKSGCRALTRRAQSHDPFWAIFCLAGVNRLMFAAPRIIHGPVTPQDAAWSIASQGLGILIGAGMLTLPLWYSRRP
jgi:hypothetical protein